MRKRILSALLAVLFLITGLPSTVWAVGEGNMEAGGGQTETVTGDSFWNGQWGIRFCVVDVVSQSVVSATYDASNYGGLSNYWHYGKTNKFDYRNGTTLTIRQGNYTLETPAVSIPTIVRTSGAPDIKAIKNYFTDETVIRWISDVTGMAYDTLINGDYKLFILVSTTNPAGITDGQTDDVITDREEEKPVSFAQAVRWVKEHSDDVGRQHFEQGTDGDREYLAYRGTVEALAGLLISRQPWEVNGIPVTADEVWQKAQEVIRTDDTLYFLLRDTAERFAKAIAEIEVKSRQGYLRSCLWNNLQLWVLEYYSAI